MKTNLPIWAHILVVVAVTASNTYACDCNAPIANLNVQSCTCVGEELSFNACGSKDPDICNPLWLCSSCPIKTCPICETEQYINGIRNYAWDWTNDGVYDYPEGVQSGTDQDGVAYHTYTSAGTYTVKVKVRDHDSCRGCPPDKYGETTRQITVVEVNKVQYLEPGNGYKDITGTLYIAKDACVKFKAIPNPSTASWPNSRPKWWRDSTYHEYGGTKDIAFPTLSTSSTDYKVVKAQCGTSTVTVNVIVYHLDGVLTPDDNFSGRSQSNYGIAEKVECDCTITPSGVTPSQVGGLRWSEELGKGTLSNITNSGTADFDAGTDIGAAILRLEVKSGPSKGRGKNYMRTIVEPSSSSYMEQKGTRLKHTYNTWSTGCRGYTYLAPQNVSFENTMSREGYCDVTCHGWLSWHNYPHPEGPECSVLGGDVEKGCQVAGIDELYSGCKGPDPDPYDHGYYTWHIPWEYKAGDMSDYSTFTYATMHVTSDPDGTAKITKKGINITSFASDPSSEWD